MANIDFGSGANTATGDTVRAALAKLQARIDALASAPPAAAPSVTVADVTASEASGSLPFVLTRSGTLTGVSVVGYSTASGSAASADYASTSGQITFAAGEASRAVSVPVNNNSTVDGSRTVLLNLTAVSNVTIARAQAVGTITDDDTASATPPLTILLVGSSTPERYGTEYSGPSNARVFKSGSGTNFAAAGTTGQGLTTLGNLLANVLNRDIRFITKGVSATTLSQWEAAGSSQRSSAITAAKAAGTVDAIISIVGFNDARFNEVASSDGHAAKLRSFFSKLRSELGQPNVPIFIGTSQNYTEGAATGEQQELWVRYAEMAVAADANNRLYAHSYDLAQSDGIHMANGQYTTHATRGSKAILALVQGTTYNPADAGPTPPSAAGPVSGGGSEPSSNTARIDFASTLTVTGFTPTGWNRYAAAASETAGAETATYTLSTINNIAGVATGWSLANTTGLQGGSTSGATTGANTGVYPDNVLQTYHFNGDDAGTSNLGAAIASTTYRLSGLNPAKTYTLRFLGNRSGADRTTEYKAGGQSVTLNTNSNTANTVQIAGLVPNASGQIDFSFGRFGSSTFGYLNALEIIQS